MIHADSTGFDAYTRSGLIDFCKFHILSLVITRITSLELCFCLLSLDKIYEMFLKYKLYRVLKLSY